MADGHRSDTDEQTDSSSWIIKWLFYAALFIGAIWLAFAVVLPLIIIDCAMISLLVGLIYKKGKQYWLILSIIGTLFVFLDYNNGWVTKKLVENVAFFSNTMPFLVYLNLVAGLISSYFLVTALLKVRVRSVNYDRNSSRNNLIIVGGLAAIGASVFLIQSHINLNRSFDSANLVYNSGQTSQSQQTVADPTIVTLPSQSTSSTAGAGNTTVKNGEFVGQFFEVKIPNGFTVRPSLEGVKGRGGYGEYQSVFAQSPDNQVEFYMFGGFLDDMATDVAIDPNREKRVSISTQKSKSGVTTTWTELKALNNSYFKAYQDTKNPAGNEHWVVGLRYNTQAAYNLYKQQYLAFKKSYTELGGD